MKARSRKNSIEFNIIIELMQFIIERNRKENVIVNYIFSWFILDIQGRIVQIDSHQVQEDGKFTAFAATTIIFFYSPIVMNHFIFKIQK